MNSKTPVVNSSLSLWLFLQGATTLANTTLTERPTMVLDEANETRLGTLADHLQVLWVLRDNLKGQLTSIQADIDDLIASHKTDLTSETFRTALNEHVTEFKKFLLPFHMVCKLLESSLNLDFRGLNPLPRPTICIRKDFVVIARANDLREDWKCPCKLLADTLSKLNEPAKKPGLFMVEIMLGPVPTSEVPKDDAAEPTPQAEASAAAQG